MKIVTTLVIGMAAWWPMAAALSVATTSQLKHPRIIQGGMGIRISSWQLARTVAEQGELGVVSATGIDTVMVRTLQLGDPEGHVRRALAAFPDPNMARRILDRFYIEGGKPANKPFRSLPMWSLSPSQDLLEATVVANFCEVWLAKHSDENAVLPGLVGVNRLTKVGFPTLASLYGAILANVDYVIMGAGIPLTVPGALDALAAGEDATFPIDVAGEKEARLIQFSPQSFWTTGGRPDLAKIKLQRPNFIPIVSSVVLAQSLLKRANGSGPTHGINGFVVELPSAGGHNAPPRGFRYDPVSRSHAVDLNDRGEPVYGQKDEVDLVKFLKTSKDLPVWLAGSYAHPDKLQDLVKLGANGIQVGTLFALSNESGMDPTTRSTILTKIKEGDLDVFTDPVASPTGYPFKVLKLESTLANDAVYNARPRQCSLGYLRTPYIDPVSGKLGYRCPAEPVDDWVKKGGDVEATVGRKCLCNALMANVGLAQTRWTKDGNTKKLYVEDQLITIGDEVNFCRRLLRDDQTGFSAKNVIEYLRSELGEAEAQKALKDVVFGDAVTSPEPTKAEI